jgi:hypothetical protein
MRPFVIFAGLVGGAVGIVFSFIAMFAGDSPSHTPERVFGYIESPVFALMWVLTHLGLQDDQGMNIFFMFHFGYWALLGALVFGGVAWLWVRVTGSE